MNIFFVDDVIRNYDETQEMMRMATQNRIVMVEAWRKIHDPSYIDAFHEILDLMDRVEQLLLHEEYLTKDIPLVAFEKRR